MSNSFETFKDLPDELQREAIREGEKRLEAQLSVATAADSRALTWSGFLLTAATAALGGGIALINKEKPDLWLAVLAILFAGALLRAAWFSLGTTKPKLFCLPGNRPGLWLPAEWNCSGTDKRKIQNARAEQAEYLDKHIRENAEEAKERAGAIISSFKWARLTVLIGGIALLATVVFRQLAIGEIASQIVDRIG